MIISLNSCFDVVYIICILRGTVPTFLHFIHYKVHKIILNMPRQPLLLDSDEQDFTTTTSRSDFYCTSLKPLLASCLPSVKMSRTQVAGYTSGALFTLGHWLFIDGIAILYATPSSIQVGFEDFVPGILGTISLIM